MGKPLVYFARRVEHSDPAEDLLREDVLFIDYQDIKRAYLNKNVEYKDFIK